MRCTKKSTTFCLHPCQPLLSQTAASSLSLHHLLCPFLVLPLKQPEVGGLSWTSSAAKTGMTGPPPAPRDPRGLLWPHTACSSALGSPLCQLPWAGRRAEGQERAAAHAPSLHPAESGCHRSGMAQPLWKLAGLGLGGTHLSPAGLCKWLSCCCQERRGLSHKDRQPHVHPVKMTVAVW